MHPVAMATHLMPLPGLAANTNQGNAATSVASLYSQFPLSLGWLGLFLLCFILCPFAFPRFFFWSGRPDVTHHSHRTLVLDTYTSSVVMTESWIQREFLTPRRLAFNVLFYGTHLVLFAYGWYSQVHL